MKNTEKHVGIRLMASIIIFHRSAWLIAYFSPSLLRYLSSLFSASRSAQLDKKERSLYARAKWVPWFLDALISPEIPSPRTLANASAHRRVYATRLKTRTLFLFPFFPLFINIRRWSTFSSRVLHRFLNRRNYLAARQYFRTMRTNYGSRLLAYSCRVIKAPNTLPLQPN